LLWWANQKHWAAVRSYLSHSFLQLNSAAEPFTSHGAIYAEPQPFSSVKPAYVQFASSIFTVQDHIPSAPTDALRSLLYWQLFANLVWGIKFSLEAPCN
jgi:hypothetical protein